ncbi:MAG: hypothetical protein DRH44_05480 [Candidatus Coatesbacteria bacterium]|nr:MAG: hypothetical protein DRH44_05480 [Candidatus Coatesbacteria bacterium]
MYKVIKNITLLLFTLLLLVLFLTCAKVGTPPGRSYETEREIKITIGSVEVIDRTHLVITFSSAISPDTALDIKNYSIYAEGGTVLKIEDIIDNRKDVVTLITEPMEEVNYRLTITNMKDEQGFTSREAIITTFKGSDSDDHTPPAVVKIYPKKGDKNITANPTITVIFNDIMDEYSTIKAIELTDDLNEQIPFRISRHGAIWHILPERALHFSTEYKLKIDDEARDISGNNLYAPTTIKFTTINDYSCGSISGYIQLNEDVTETDIDIVISTDSSPLPAYRTPITLTSPAEDGSFTFKGLSPTTEDKLYYIHAFLDTDADGIYDMYDTSGPISLKKREVKTGILLTPKVVDRIGPEILTTKVYPAQYIEGDIMLTAEATDMDTGGQTIKQMEAFIGEIASNGTGFPLYIEDTVDGKTGGSTIIPEELLKFKGAHTTLHIHALDSEGNWGDFNTVEITKSRVKTMKIEGKVTLEAEPVPEALVIIENNDQNPVAIGRCDDEGRFNLEYPISEIISTITAFSDINGNNHFDDGEPVGSVKFTEGIPINILLSHPPEITYACARVITTYDEMKNLSSDITLTAIAGDDDFDLKNVYAELPWGEKVELKDDGNPPDREAGDGIFNAIITINKSNASSATSNEVRKSVVIVATDSIGNQTNKTDKNFTGLKLEIIPPVLNISAEDDGKEIKVKWDTVEEDRRYMVFIVPSDKLTEFKGENTSEVWSNVNNPTEKPSLIIKREDVKRYWGYPSGYRFIVFVYSYSPDRLRFDEYDVGVNSGILIHR